MNQTKAQRIMSLAKSTQSRIRWRMLKGQFAKCLINAKLSPSLFESAMREFHRVAPFPPTNRSPHAK